MVRMTLWSYTTLTDVTLDGGTERKLQVRALRKNQCRVHATWRLEPET